MRAMFLGLALNLRQEQGQRCCWGDAHTQRRGQAHPKSERTWVVNADIGTTHVDHILISIIYPKAEVLKLWSPDQQNQHHQEAC